MGMTSLRNSRENRGRPIRPQITRGTNSGEADRSRPCEHRSFSFRKSYATFSLFLYECLYVCCCRAREPRATTTPRISIARRWRWLSSPAHMCSLAWAINYVPIDPGFRHPATTPLDDPQPPPSTTPPPHKHHLVVDSCSFLVAALVALDRCEHVPAWDT